MSISFEMNSYVSGSEYQSGYGSPQLNLKIQQDDSGFDPYAIGDDNGARNWDTPGGADGEGSGGNGQGVNDFMAVMEYIAMLLAILSQLFQGSQNQSDSEEPPGAKSNSSSKPRWSESLASADSGSRDDQSPSQRLPYSLSSEQEPADIKDKGAKPGSQSNTPETTDKLPSKPSVNAATGGVSPDSTQLVSTGTGNGHYFNVVNNTDRPQTFAFSSNSSNTSGYSNTINAVMTLQPGQTGTFESGSDVPGIRINSSGAKGETHGNEALYEDTVEQNPMGGGVVHNPDVSDVAGKLSYDGRPQRIAVSDGTRWIGDGTETGVYDYDVEDKDPNRATNPMNMALDPSNSYTIVFSDG